MTRRARRVIEGEPIDVGDDGDAPDLGLGELVPPRAREVLEDLRAVASLGKALADVAERRRNEARGVIDLQEIAPGVYAAPKPRPRRENTNVGRMRSIVDAFGDVARDLHGRRR